MLIKGKKIKTSQHAIHIKINKMHYVYTEDCYSAMKRKEIPEKAGWLNLEKAVLYEKGQIKRLSITNFIYMKNPKEEVDL